MAKNTEKRKSLFSREIMKEFIKENNIVTVEDAQKAARCRGATDGQEKGAGSKH